MTDPNATTYPFDCEPESKVAKCDVEAMERKLAEYETAARARAMTSEREIEARARLIYEAWRAERARSLPSEVSWELVPPIDRELWTRIARSLDSAQKGESK